MATKQSHVSDAFARKLSAAQRALLVDHIDGELTISTAHQRPVRESLMRLGLLRGTTPHSNRPRATVLTEAGRMAVGKILGECADALIRAGLLQQERPLDVLRRLRAMRTGDLPPEQPESLENQA